MIVVRANRGEVFFILERAETRVLFGTGFCVAVEHNSFAAAEENRAKTALEAVEQLRGFMSRTLHGDLIMKALKSVKHEAE